MSSELMPLAEFVLPFPPSVNTYWRHGSRGHYVAAAGKAFRSNVLASVVESLGRMPKPVEGQLAMELELYPPTKGQFDVDNFCKGTLDALAEARVYADDSQIKRLTVEMFPSVGKPGRAVVRLYEYQHGANQ